MRRHLARLFDTRYQGTLRVEFSNNRGFIDGYVAAVEELYVVNSDELLLIVVEERHAAATWADMSFSCLSSAKVPSRQFV